MAKFYGKKILNGAINPKTGTAWTIEDVHERWRAATEEWLKENAEE